MHLRSCGCRRRVACVAVGVEDLHGVRKGYALTFMRLPKSRPVAAEDLPKPDVVFKRGMRWSPFRSVATWYLWRACDLAKIAPPSGQA